MLSTPHYDHGHRFPHLAVFVTPRRVLEELKPRALTTSHPLLPGLYAASCPRVCPILVLIRAHDILYLHLLASVQRPT